MMYEKEHKDSKGYFMAGLVIVTLTVFLIISSGCSNTCRGFGGVLNGVGQTIAGAGQDIQQAVDNQSK